MLMTKVHRHLPERLAAALWLDLATVRCPKYRLQRLQEIDNGVIPGIEATASVGGALDEG
jgi:hypothetical protein